MRNIYLWSAAMLAIVVIGIVVIPAATTNGYKPSVGAIMLKDGMELDLRSVIKDRMSVTMRVFKNGELVFQKVGDPISNNWLAVVTNTLLGVQHVDGLSFKRPDGVQYGPTSQTASIYYPISLYARLGNGVTASYDDYELTSLVKAWSIVSDPFIISDNGTHINVTIVVTYVAESAGEQYSEAGLSLYYNYDGYNKISVLIVHDVFGSVTLNQGDELTIAWVFIIDYSAPPLVKEFWYRLISIGLGGKAYGHDYGYIYGVKDYTESRLYIGFVTTSLSWSPDIKYSDISANIVLSPELDAGAIGRSAVAQTIKLTVVRNAGVDVTVYGLALVVYNQGTNYIVAYWDLGNAITINQDTLVKLSIEIALNGP